ncbi:SDR family NAD(P)-dependent oxidoreductase [Herbiconiux liangxiaofengii]|uniref:SDR family NAD(P)-dependent oxidoreductase n=1 Tax=Herbiconiux liangxiaofengii TaxID=3342795 RepID=UPI0035BB7C75
MAGKLIVITGASDGIGAAAARALSGRHTVVVVGRSPEKTRAVAESIGAEWLTSDFSVLDDVRALAGTLLERYPRIDVLANNAGGIMGPRTETVDGHEQTFQVNHLAPFLLTNLLMPRLIESRASVIATSSLAHLYGSLDLGDLDGRQHYRPERAYGNAKLENLLFTRELHRRFHDRGVSAAAFHPGAVSTSFASSTNSGIRMLYTGVLRRLLRTPEQGAETLVWLAAGTPGVDWQSGDYFVKRAPASIKRGADDPALARELWERSEAMLA